LESLLIQKNSKCATTVWIHNKLGWDNFLEGRGKTTTEQKIETQCRQMDEGANEMTTSDNAPTIDILECYCTLKIKDGRTTAQHEAILSEILECAHVDPVDLLAEHQHLVGCNCTKQVTGPVKDKGVCVVEMNAARGLARHIAKGTRVALKTRYGKTRGNLPQRNIVIEEVVVDNVGSLKWRRRKQC